MSVKTVQAILIAAAMLCNLVRSVVAPDPWLGAAISLLGIAAIFGLYA